MKGARGAHEVVLEVEEEQCFSGLESRQITEGGEEIHSYQHMLRTIDSWKEKGLQAGELSSIKEREKAR
jgi:hypothetical protein